MEKYRNGHIFYGQGNLILEYDIDYESFFKGYIIDITLDDSGDLTSLDIIPYTQSKNHIGTQIKKIFKISY